METSLAFHIVGLVMWVGSLMILTRCLKVFTVKLPDEAQEGVNNFRNSLRRIFFGFSLGGAAVSLVSGVYQISLRGLQYYMKQGWFHAKLTLVLLLFVVTWLLWQEMAKIKRGEVISSKKAIALHAISATSMVVIVFLTILNR